MLCHITRTFRLNPKPSAGKALLHSRTYTTALGPSKNTRNPRQGRAKTHPKMPEIIDDKSEHCVPFLLDHLKAHQARYGASGETPPLFLGLNGVQGAGKTVLVSLSDIHLLVGFNAYKTAGWLAGW